MWGTNKSLMGNVYQVQYALHTIMYSHENAPDSGQMYELCIDRSIHLRVN